MVSTTQLRPSFKNFWWRFVYQLLQKGIDELFHEQKKSIHVYLVDVIYLKLCDYSIIEQVF